MHLQDPGPSEAQVVHDGGGDVALYHLRVDQHPGGWWAFPR